VLTYTTASPGSLYEVRLCPVIPIGLSNAAPRTRVTAIQNCIDDISVSFYLAHELRREIPLPSGTQIPEEYLQVLARGQGRITQ